MCPRSSPATGRHFDLPPVTSWKTPEVSELLAPGCEMHTGCGTGRVWAAALFLLAVHAVLLAYSATRHSPTLNEPAHLVAGLRIWRFGRYELYRVNPPMTKMIAALPVLAAGCEEDWRRMYDYPGARLEFELGADFIRANGERSFRLFTLARWGCIPISLVGGLFCFLWSRELWQSNLAGLLSLLLWCFEPNTLAHAELITPDCAAAGFGVGASWLFWRWLRQPSWTRAVAAGSLLGVAQLTKMTWVILFGLWPVLWIFAARFSRPQHSRQPHSAGAFQLAAILVIGLYVLNLGYCFDGTFTPVGDYLFVSRVFTGHEEPGEVGNRFADSWAGEVRLPLPRHYLLGLDLQMRDFEDYPSPSYLWGEWKQGGWWYYYLCGLLFKVPHALQGLFLLAVVLWCTRRRWRGADRTADAAAASLPNTKSLILLAAPALVVFVLVSSQTEFNHHFRYVLPVFPFVFVFCGIAARWVTES